MKSKLNAVAGLRAIVLFASLVAQMYYSDRAQKMIAPIPDDIQTLITAGFIGGGAALGLSVAIGFFAGK